MTVGRAFGSVERGFNMNAKYRIVATIRSEAEAKCAVTSDVYSAHAIADTLRDAKYQVQVWLWSRRQRKVLTAVGYRWRAGYVETAI